MKAEESMKPMLEAEHGDEARRAVVGVEETVMAVGS